MARNFPPRPQRGAPQQGAPQQGAPQQDAPQQGPVQEDAPQQGASPQEASQPAGGSSSASRSIPSPISAYAPAGMFDAPDDSAISPELSLQPVPERPLPEQTIGEWTAAIATTPQYAVLPELYQRPIDTVLTTEEREAPSLPIILVSAAMGIIGGVSTYFILQQLFNVRIEYSVAMAVLALCFSLGATGGILSAATGSRAAVPNILFSCGVILLAGLFLGLCMVVGALGATLTLFLQG